MNRRIHLILILGCVIIAALDAPRASRLFAEGLSGPYEARVEPPRPPVLPPPVVPPGDPRAEALQQQQRQALLQAQIADPDAQR